MTRALDRPAVAAAATAVFVGGLVSGREAFAVGVGLVGLVVYWDLRPMLGAPSPVVTRLIGAGGVAAAFWLGYDGRLEDLPWVGAVVVLAVLVGYVFAHEFGRAPAGIVADVSATVTASVLAGAVGAHVLLIRAVDRVGWRGAVVFVATVAANRTAAYLIEHRLGDARWRGWVAGAAAGIAVGAAAGLWADPPFDLTSGVAFGAAMGVAVPIGHAGVASLRGPSTGGGGLAVAVLGPVCLAAPVYYWAFRTVAV